MGMRNTFVSLSLAAAAAVALTSVGDPGSDPKSERSNRQTDFKALAAALGSDAGGTIFRPYSRLADFLPNVGHVSDLAPSSPPTRMTDSVVSGTVVEVSDDRGFIESGAAPTKGRPGAAVTVYDDPAAHWRTVRVRVHVQEVLAGTDHGTLKFFLPLIGNAKTGEDAAAVERALRALGDVIVFSKAVPEGLEYLGIARNLPDEGHGLASLSAAGEIEFPFAGDESTQGSAEFEGGVNTLDQLRAEARKPERTVKS